LKVTAMQSQWATQDSLVICRRCIFHVSRGVLCGEVLSSSWCLY